MNFTIKSLSEVPAPHNQSAALAERQALYEGFVKKIAGTEYVGELEPAPEEGLRGIKVSLRRASTRLGEPLDIWDANDRVFFRPASPSRRKSRR